MKLLVFIQFQRKDQTSVSTCKLLFYISHDNEISRNC